MLETRVIPVLQIQGRDLVKTTQFRKPIYIGDPLNAVRIFNKKEVDELIILDIGKTKSGGGIDLDYVAQLAEEALMPVAYGGGLNSLEEMIDVIKVGIEKVVINSLTHRNLEIIKEASHVLGNQSIVASVDCRKKWIGKEYHLYSKGGSIRQQKRIEEHLQDLVEAGVGEIMITSIDNDGRMKGYDIALVKKVAQAVNVPVIANGGAGTIDHLVRLAREEKVQALAGGSIFMFKGREKGILLNYIDRDERLKLNI